MHEAWACNVQYGDCNKLYCITYLKITEKVYLKSSYEKKNNILLTTYGNEH